MRVERRSGITWTVKAPPEAFSTVSTHTVGPENRADAAERNLSGSKSQGAGPTCVLVVRRSGGAADEELGDWNGTTTGASASAATGAHLYNRAKDAHRALSG